MIIEKLTTIFIMYTTDFRNITTYVLILFELAIFCVTSSLTLAEPVDLLGTTSSSKDSFDIEGYPAGYFYIIQNDDTVCVEPVLVSQATEDEWFKYTSASTHTGFEKPKQTRSFFFYNPNTGNMGFFVVHNIDNGPSDGWCKMYFFGLPDSTKWAHSDDNPDNTYVSYCSERVFIDSMDVFCPPGVRRYEFNLDLWPQGCWHWWSNTDAGACYLPRTEWKFAIDHYWDRRAAACITKWRFVSGTLDTVEIELSMNEGDTLYLAHGFLQLLTADSIVIPICTGDATFDVDIKNSHETVDTLHIYDLTHSNPMFSTVDYTEKLAPGEYGVITVELTGVDSGTYVDTIWATTDEPCGTDPIIVYTSIAPSPVVSDLENKIICKGGAVNIGDDPLATEGTPPYYIVWRDSSEFFSTAENPVVTPENTTNYFLTISDSRGCFTYDTVRVMVSDPIADAGDDVEYYTCNASDTAVLGGDPVAAHGLPPYNYTWRPGLFLSDSAAEHPIAFPESVMTYLLRVTDSIGCVDYDTVTVRVYTVGVPLAKITRPAPCDGITSCEYQDIKVHIWDTSGYAIAESSLVLEVDGNLYTTNSSDLTWYPDSGVLILEPSVPWDNEEVVEFELMQYRNTIGCLGDPKECSFIVDLKPPEYEFVSPGVDKMLDDQQPEMIFNITDNLSGIAVGSIELEVNGEIYTLDDFIWIRDNREEGHIIFQPAAIPISYSHKDTVHITLSACDTPDYDYCPPNCSDSSWELVIAPKTVCRVHPNPFTPNDDAVNEIAVFDYPHMFSASAKLSIYTVRNVEVWSEEIGPITSFDEYLKRHWDGKDDDDEPLPEGLYIYIIQRDGKVICNGTVTLGK